MHMLTGTKSIKEGHQQDFLLFLMLGLNLLLPVEAKHPKRKLFETKANLVPKFARPFLHCKTHLSLATARSFLEGKGCSCCLLKRGVV